MLVVCGCGRFGFSGSNGGDASGITDDVGGGSAVGDALTDGVAVVADAPRPCGGTTHTLTDNFDDNTFDMNRWARSYEDSVSRHVETGGRVEMRLGPNIADNWAGYVATNVLELKEDRVFVEVPVAPVYDSNAILLLWTSTAKTDGPSIEWEANKLMIRRRINGIISELANVPYNAVAQRWWQIRERSGTLYWEVSPDGVTWTVLHQIATPAQTTALITLAAGTGIARAQTDLAVFDNFNGGGAPPACP